MEFIQSGLYKEETLIFLRHRKKVNIIFVIFPLLLLTLRASAHEMKENHYNSLIPDNFITIEISENNKEYALIIEKDTQKAFLYQCNDSFEEISILKCSTGEVPGIKSCSGDRKTPEGVYFFTREHKKKDLTPIYGSMAFPIDYPNCLDRIKGNGGNSIWMHGTNKKLKDRDTNGCIVFKNSDIDRLSNYITLNRTPIIIVDKITYRNRDTDNEAEKHILLFLSLWKDALQNGDYHEYLAHYDSDYLPDIGWWSGWNVIRKKTYSLNLPFSIEIERKSIFKHGRIYVVLFNLVLSSSERNMPVATKKLFLEYKGNQLKIIGEEYQSIDYKLEQYEEKNPIVAALDSIKSENDKEQEIAGMVDRWLKAWSSKNIDEYGKCYAKEFYSNGMNLKKWLRHKRRMNRKYSYISVTKDNLVIYEKGGKFIASFLQTYESSGYKAVGTKILDLKYEQGEWKIFRENWVDIN